jgi:DNA-binding transcriptional LysR family regulator
MFLESARALLAQAEQAVVAVRRAAQGQTGLLRAAIDPAATYHDAVPAALRRFRERSPMVQVSLRECRSADQVAMLRRGDIEIGFVCTPLEHEGVVLETVTSEPLMLALPEMHALSRVPTARLALLSGDRWIMPERDAAPGIYDTIVRFCMDAGFSPVAGAQAGRTETAVALVAAGLGVALVPGPAERLARAGVRFVPTHEQPQRIEIAAAHLAGSESPVVPAFLEILRSKEKN